MTLKNITVFDNIAVSDRASSGSLHEDAGSNPGGAKVVGRHFILHFVLILCLTMRAFVVFALQLLIYGTVVNPALS